MRHTILNNMSRDVFVEQQLRKHNTDIIRLMRRIGHVEAGTMVPNVAGSADIEWGGPSVFYFCEPQSDFHRCTSDVLGKLYEWDSAGKVWTPTGREKIIRTDFWRGYTFQDEPIFAVWQNEPGKLYAVGSGHQSFNGTTTTGIPFQGFGDIENAGFTISAYGLYGEVGINELCGAHWDDVDCRWVATIFREWFYARLNAKVTQDFIGYYSWIESEPCCEDPGKGLGQFWRDKPGGRSGAFNAVEQQLTNTQVHRAGNKIVKMYRCTSDDGCVETPGQYTAEYIFNLDLTDEPPQLRVEL